MSKNTLIAIATGVVLAGFGLFTVLNGSEDETSAENIDAAFVTGMVPHHEGAIEMAELARKQARHSEIIELADKIIGSQSNEIATLNAIHDRLGVESGDGQEADDLGLDHAAMGMAMDPDALATAEPFDREFIDQMIPHHQGAIRMARIALRQGEDQETKELALAIVDAQAAEIERMNRWRQDWFGAPSPAGGVPSLDEPAPADDDMEGMDH